MSDRISGPEPTDREQPPWLVRILGPSGGTAGTGVAVDGEHVITCAHVIDPSPNAPADPDRRIELELPFSGRAGTATAEILEDAWYPVRSDGSGDLAVLRLAEPIADLTPAPLKRIPCTPGTEVEARGFPDDQPVNRTSQGRLSNSSRPEWVQVDPVGARGWAVKPGFSGGPVWDRRHEAVIGLTVARDGDDSAHMLPLRYLCELWPSLAERLEPIPPAPERDLSHWWPRARGVSSPGEEGWLFRGRERALTEIKDWLETGRRHTVLVVTGTPGTGKSAVLGRLVTTSHRRWAERLPEEDTAVRARPGSIDCAVHAKDQTALEVAEAILARAEGGNGDRRLDSLRDFPAALAEALAEVDQFNLVLDALDEATDPAEARQMASMVLRPIAEMPRTKVIVGSRRLDADGNLLAHFGDGLRTINLDAPAYFELQDLADYAEAALRQASGEWAADRGNDSGAYDDPRTAARVAARIAALSKGNFLVAGLVARSHGRFDRTPVAPEDLSFTADVSVAFWNYLRLLKPFEGIEAESLLTTLAFAEAPGFTAELWATAIEALDGREVNPRRLTHWARKEAANFLIESGSGDDRSFRLFHQALVEACWERRTHIETRSETEAALTEAFMDLGRSNGWEQAPKYLWHALPGHADRANYIDGLLNDLEFLVVADPVRLLPTLSQASGDRATLHATIYRASSGHFNLAPLRERRSVLAYNAARCKADEATESFSEGPGTDEPEWKLLWATGNGIDSRLLLSIPTLGHIEIVHCTTMAGQPIAVTPFGRDFLDAWDLTSGNHVAEVRTTPHGPISALGSTQIAGKTMVVAGHQSGAVSVIDLSAERVDRTINHQVGSAVTTLACTEIDGHPTVLYADLEGELWMAGLESGHSRSINPDGTAEILDLACAVFDGRSIAVSVDADGFLILSEFTSEQQNRIVLSRRSEPTLTRAYVASTVVHGTPVAITGDLGGRIEIWDLVTHQRKRVLKTPTSHTLRSISCAELNGNLNVVASCQNEDILIWRLDPSENYSETIVAPIHTVGDLGATDCLTVGDEFILAAPKPGGTIQVWSPYHGMAPASPHERPTRIDSLTYLRGTDRSWIAGSSAPGDIALWDTETGTQVTGIRRPGSWEHIREVKGVTFADVPHLVTLSTNGDLQIMRVDKYHPIKTIPIGFDWDMHIACAALDDRAVVVVSRSDGSLHLWDLDDGELLREIDTWPSSVIQDLDTLQIGGEPHAATVDQYDDIQTWNLLTGEASEYLASIDRGIHAKAFASADLGGKPVAALSEFNSISIVDLETRREISYISLPDPIRDLAFTDDGCLAVLSGQDIALFKYAPRD